MAEHERVADCAVGIGGAVIMLGGLNPYWTQKKRWKRKNEQLFTRVRTGTFVLCDLTYSHW